MKKIVIKSVALVFAMSLIVSTARAQETAENMVLNRWLGSWISDVVINPSIWFPKRVQWNGTSKVQWIVEHHMHMQLITTHIDKKENIALQRYNSRIIGYEMWTFSKKNSAYYVGSWNDKSNTMAWKFVDFGAGITGKIVDHFTGEDKWQRTLLLKNKEGNVLLDIQFERTRSKQKTK